jgi:hypothetical protein
MKMKRFVIAALPFVMSCLAGISGAGAETRPVVVELFTSQGCSSCPPADAVLAELAQRNDVLALGFHIDYWDNLGWKDPLSAPGSTARQRNYAALFGKKEIYTPQAVIDGRRQLIGSHRDAVLQAVAQAEPEAVAPVAFASGGRSVSIGTGMIGAEMGQGKVILVRFIRSRSTPVRRGENAGSMAIDANGVETFKTIADWSGQKLDLPIEAPEPGYGLAVLVQADDGRILGAGSYLLGS